MKVMGVTDSAVQLIFKV